MNDEELSQLLRRHASRHPAGEDLRAAVRTQIALQSAAREPVSHVSTRQGWLAVLGAGWRGLGVAGAAGLAAGIAITLAGQHWRDTVRADDLGNELVARHVQAMQVGPLFEVASSSRHQVKPWFQGRLDYAPPVFDSVPGVPLLGGRVQQVQGRPTAVLAYQMRLHKIDLFVWPTQRGSAPERLQRRGFNLVRWDDGAMQYWVVSDMDGKELEQFVVAWRAVASAGGRPG